MNFLKRVFYYKIGKELRDCASVLDIGCGRSSILEKIPKHFYAVGVDGYEPNIAESRQKGTHDDYVLSDVRTVTFPQKSFDGIVSFELIEHLEKEDGLRLLANMEQWAKRKIIISTPNGFLSQRANDNALEEHKSGWTPAEFRRLGFQVRGLQGLRIFARRKSRLANFLWKATFPLVYFTPGLSWRLLAIKTIPIGLEPSEAK